MPLLPTGLTTTRISYNQVDIELLVNNISYTPEQYFVAYGTNSQYQYRSEVHTGNTDFTTVGERLTITLTNLQYNQQYQYRVVAQNSVGTVSSKVFSFRTETLGTTKYCFVLIIDINWFHSFTSSKSRSISRLSG